MTIDYPVPFYSNTPDDTHCAQATIRSIRKFFEPSVSFSWHELDTATGKEPGKSTWRMTGLMWLATAGYDVIDITTFDYDAFATRGMEYLIEHYGPELAAWEEEWSNIPLERVRAAEIGTRINTQHRIATQDDIRQRLADGYLVQLTVNMRRLNEESGYWGHAILIKGCSDEHFIVHDPGLPAHKNRIVANDLLEAAWSNDMLDYKVMSAFKYTGYDTIIHS